MTPCYYCDIRSVGNCKTCIHSDTYEEPTTLKELTYEEIIDCAGEAGFKWSEAKGIFVRHSNGSWIGIDPNIANFARAILRKASEK